MRSNNAASALALAVGAVLIAGAALAAGLEPLPEVPVPAGNPQTPEKVELGRTLFFDRRLSGDGTTSCALDRSLSGAAPPPPGACSGG